LRRFPLDVDLHVEEPTAIVGPSGAGKTTLLRLLAGLLVPSAGRVACGGEVWFDGRRSTPPQERRVGFVFQDYALFPHMTVRANVAYGARTPVDEMLERMGIDHLAGIRPSGLSGGERQRVAVARALAYEPKLLLLDEPLSALDPATRGTVSDHLAATISAAGVPAVVVTHSYEEALALARRIVVIEDGRITQDGPAADLLRAPRTGFVARFAGLNYLEGAADGRDVVLDSGQVVHLAEPESGRVAILIAPWDITLARADPGDSSARNHLTGRVEQVVAAGSRVRVGVGPVTAEITAESCAALGLERGTVVTASFKSTAIKTIALGSP
jgi:molybdate transport system ATP-binding protein